MKKREWAILLGLAVAGSVMGAAAEWFKGTGGLEWGFSIMSVACAVIAILALIDFSKNAWSRELANHLEEAHREVKFRLEDQPHLAGADIHMETDRESEWSPHSDVATRYKISVRYWVPKRAPYGMLIEEDKL